MDVGIIVEVAVSEVAGQLPSLLLEAQFVTDLHGPVEQDAAVVPLDVRVAVQTLVL